MTKQNIVGLGLAATMAASVALSPQSAQAGSKERGILTLGAGAATIFGLATHRRSVAAIGAIGTAVGYHNYRAAKKREDAARDARLRRESYYQGASSNRYYGSNSYSGSTRHYSVSPYRYESGGSSYSHARRVAATHRYRPVAHHYPYHPWLHQTHAVAARVQPHAPVAAALQRPQPSVVAAAPVASQLQPVAALPAASVAPAAAVAAASVSSTSFAAGFGTGLVTLLLGLGLGIALTRFFHRAPVENTAGRLHV